MSDMPGYRAAQAAYDNMSPPEDGPSECPECNGNGYAPVPGDPEGDYAKCSVCNGFGLISENGEPFDPKQAERDAADAADHKRDYERDRRDREADGEYDDEQAF